MGTLDLLRIGRTSRKNFINKSHDVNTTSDFGFCQPILFDTVLPGSNVSLKTKEFVRLAPLPTPTFGRVKVHTDTSFVKIKDVFPAFDNLMDQMSVNNPNVVGGYIPQGHNYIQKGDLIASLLILSFYYSSIGEYDKVPFRFDVFFNGPVKKSELSFDGDDARNPSHTFSWRSVLNDVELNSQDLKSVWSYLTSGYCNISRLLGKSGKLYSYFSNLYNSDSFDLRDISPSSGNCEDDSLISAPDIGLFLTYLKEREDVIYTSSSFGQSMGLPIPSYFDDSLGSILVKFITGDVIDDKIKDLYCKFPNILSDPISLENSDYLYVLDNSILGDDFNYRVVESNALADDVYDLPLGENYKFILCLKLTPFGRRLMKVFTGLYNTDCLSKNIPNFTDYLSLDPWGNVSQHDVISLTPLFAYFKHWFDLYNPNRDKNWYETNCYKLIHCFYDYPMPLHYWFYREDGDSFSSSDYYYERTENSFVSLRKAWFDLLLELGQCVYVLPVDNITVATPTPLQSVQSDISKVDMPYHISNDPSESNPNPTISSVNGAVSDNYPYGAWIDGNNDRASGLGVTLALRLYNWSNKNSVIAKNIRGYLKRYNIELPQENILDRSSYYAQIDDVFSTAETSDGFLGEYAGKGIGSGLCSVSLKDTKEYGYLVQTLCVAPHSGYVQANQLFPITRMEHYQDIFDSLGQEVMSMRQVQARDYILSEPSVSKVFGFRPRFFDIKVKNNLANGYFAQRGTQAQYLPYSLDRIFGVKDIDSSVSTLTYTQSFYPLANEDIRKVGLVEQLGEYDRIFVDNTGMSDNFIFDILQEYKVWSPVKPVSDSFDTFDKDVDDDTYNVEHS